MLGLERKGAGQIRGPVSLQRGRQAEDEVERELLDTGARSASTARDTWSAVWVRCIHSSTSRVERLHAQRYPVDPGVPPGGRPAARVTSSGLASRVISASEAIVRSAPIWSSSRAIAAGVDPRGSATTEVDGPYLRRRRPTPDRPARAPLPEHRIDVGVGWNFLAGPRWQSRNSCTGGRRRERGGRGARRKCRLVIWPERHPERSEDDNMLSREGASRDRTAP